MMVQVDCDFVIRVVHASAADLDLERLRGSEIKKPGAARYCCLMHKRCHNKRRRCHSQFTL